MKYLIIVVALLVGFGAGATQVEYRTDDRFAQLQKIDEDIFNKYRSGLNQASIMVGCTSLEDYDCLDEASDKVEDITKDINFLFDQRKELLN